MARANDVRRVLLQRSLGVGAALLTALFAPAALQAKVPGTLLFEGALTNQAGGAATDGQYLLDFALYGSQTAQTPFWTENGVPVTVKGGRFSQALGTKTPLSPVALGAAPQVWLGVKVGLDPELARQQIHAHAFALRAVVAEGLDCTGCVASSSIKWNSDVDLFGHTIKVDQLQAKNVQASTVAAQSFVGDGSKLTGIKTVQGSCSGDQVMVGILPDGSFKCATPKGANVSGTLAGISNGVLSNQFVDSFPAKAVVQIPDNNPIGVSDEIDVPDIGLVEKLTVSVNLTNSDLNKLEVILYDPNNAKYVLFDKSSSGKTINTVYPDPSKPVSGDLTSWIGNNPKGKWRLHVVDSGFLNNTFDGDIKSWSVNLHTVSNGKVQVNGKALLTGGAIIGKSNAACTAEIDGLLKRNADGWLEMCQSGQWVGVLNNHCPPPGVLIDGVCLAGVFGGNPNFVDASKYCASLHADLCTDSQSWVLRRSHMLDSTANWTNSFADNDGGQWSEANGGTGDNHGWTSGWQAPCCYNITPPRATDKDVAGVRVVYVHNTQNVYFRQAAYYCAAMNADLCSKAEYWVMRQNKVVTTAVWASDHSDNDNTSAPFEKGIGPVSDDPTLGQHYAFACCASKRTDKSSCPVERIGGVCAVHIANADSFTWDQVAQDCPKRGARVCSMAETAVLRNLKKITAGGNWSASYSDNDSGNAAVAVGNVGDDHPNTSKYAYACCL